MSTLLRAAVLGLTSGLRSLVSPAIVGWALSTGRLNRLRVLERASSPWLAGALLAGGLIEIVNDKLPYVPPRTRAPVAAWRLGTGAVLGGVLAASEGERVIAGAVAGAGGAAIGTYGGYAARVALGRIIPEPLPGTIEDALAITLAMAAARR